MNLSPADVSPTLFAAASALIRGDQPGLLLVQRQLAAQAPVPVAVSAAAMLAGEYLRDAATCRGWQADQMLVMLRRAHQDLSPVADSAVGLVLAGAHAYVAGSSRLWSDEDMCDLLQAPGAALDAAVRVVAAAMTWRARDAGVDPGHFASAACIAIARRHADQVCASTTV